LSGEAVGGRFGRRGRDWRRTLWLATPEVVLAPARPDTKVFVHLVVERDGEWTSEQGSLFRSLREGRGTNDNLETGGGWTALAKPAARATIVPTVVTTTKPCLPAERSPRPTGKSWQPRTAQTPNGRLRPSRPQTRPMAGRRRGRRQGQTAGRGRRG
jgi:hypothetical protein